MPKLKTECPACQKKFNVTEKHIGKKVRCPSCKHKWTVENIAFSSGQSMDQRMDVLQTQDGTDADETVNRPLPKSDIRHLGRFEMKEALGGGAFGLVYKAYDPVLGRTVALKIPRFGSDDQSKTKRFLIEAHAAANLKHPNIVAVYESGEENGRPFIASEYVKGKTLSQKIKSNPPDFKEAAFLVRSLADALSYAHKEGVIHRDIKPDNIMIGEKNRPQIMDFGLAKLTDEDSQMTGEGNILGTPAYMSPEQARGEINQVGPASDQYSLGVILFELLTEERPYTGPPHSIIAQVGTDGESPEAISINKEIPRDLSAICRRAMEKDSGKRYADCDEMAEDLSRWLSGIETLARPLSISEKYKRWYRKNRTLAKLWVTVAAFFFMLLIFASVDYGRMKIQSVEQSVKLIEEGTDRLEAQRNLAINEFERGRNFCESGKLSEGLLWLANSLETLSPEMTDLEQPIRSYISSWLPQVHQLKWVFPHKEEINSVAISPDGKILITGTGSLDIIFSSYGFRKNMNPSAEGNVDFWDLDTGRSIPESIIHSSSVTKVAFSPDGKTAISASLDRSLKIFNPKTGKEIHEPVIHPHAIVGAAFNHDGSLLATGCLDGNLRVWDTKTWKQIGRSMKHDLRFPNQGIHIAANPQPLLHEIAFTSDGKYLLVNARKMAYPFIKIWNLENYQQIEYPEYFNNKLVGKFTPDGKEFLTGIEGGSFLLRNWQNPNKKGTIFNNHIFESAMAVNRLKGLVVADGEGRIAWVHDYHNSTRIGQILKHNDQIDVVEISKDGKTIVTGDDGKIVKIWSTSTERPWGTIIPHNQSAKVKYFHDSKKFITTDSIGLLPEDIVPGKPSARSRIWDSKTLELIAGPYVEEGGGGGIDISRDGRFYALGRWNSTMLRQIVDGKQIYRVSPKGVNDVVLANNDQTLITGSKDKKIRFWDVSSGEMKGEPIDLEQNVSSFVISPDRKYLLTTCNDGTTTFWNLRDRTRVSEPILHPKGVKCATFHPDGSYIATGCRDGTVYFWSVPDGKPVKKPIYNFDSQTGICSLEFTPDGTQILIAGNMKGLQFWDLESLLPASRLMMNGAWLKHVDLSPDGKTLASSNYSKTSSGVDIMIRKVAPQVQGAATKVKQMIERTLGMRLTKGGELKVLTYDEWSALSN